MLYRYGTSTKNGKRVKIATIYKDDEHAIDNSKIASEVFFIISKLKDASYEAYLVGGAVRDLLLKKEPKDFDIATSATPAQIKKIFPNSRIIGRRFQICHIFFPTTKRIIEVSTFRSSQSENFFNDYGSIYEDAFRRDFSINALYYCPLSKRLYDYVDALKDFKRRKIRSIIDLKTSFSSDPVRMIRAIKYSVKLNFKMERALVKAMRRDSKCLQNVPISRLVEEFFKILVSGNCYKVVQLLIKFNLLDFFVPNILSIVKSDSRLAKNFYANLQELDSQIDGKNLPSKAMQLSYFFKAFICVSQTNHLNSIDLKATLFSQMKHLISPLTPPNFEVNYAADIILKQLGFKPTRPKGRRRPKSTKRKSATL